MKLTAKQQKFVDEYVVSGNATQSALKAGYSQRTARIIGQENLTKPAIKAYIDAKMAEIESKKIAKADEVLQFFTRVLRQQEKETQVVATPNGAEKVEAPPTMKDRIKAGQELLKRYPVGRLELAQLKKVNADARVAEAKAKAMEDNGTDIELLLDKMLDAVTREADKSDDS